MPKTTKVQRDIIESHVDKIKDKVQKNFILKFRSKNKSSINTIVSNSLKIKKLTKANSDLKSKLEEKNEHIHFNYKGEVEVSYGFFDTRVRSMDLIEKMELAPSKDFNFKDFIYKIDLMK